MKSLSLISSFVLLIYFMPHTFAQQGKDCSKDADCNAHQTCHFGYCQCDLGYVKNIHHCFQLRKYGQHCEFDEQCNDFRMSCLVSPNGVIKRCVCGSYLKWDTELKQCTPMQNFTDMISGLEEDTTWSDQVHESANKVFYNIAAAGIFVSIFGLTCALVGVMYGCCFKGISDSSSKQNSDAENQTIQEVVGEGTGGSYIPIATDVTAGPSTTTFLAVA